MKWLSKNGTSEKNVPMLLLLAACTIEFLFIILERQFFNLGYYLAETYLIVPCMLFLGYVLRENRSRFASRQALLALAAIGWFVLVQLAHRLSNMGDQPIGTIFTVYLMAFPFAALADDRDNAGVRLLGGMFMAASLVLVFYGLLLFVDLVPVWMADYLYWDGARLQILWHPNVVASYLMIGIGFSMAFCAQTQKKSVKAALVGAVVLQMIAMALTNCRTTILLTGAMLGGTLFFLIFKGGWKQFLLGLMAAVLVLVGTFQLCGAIYRWNNDRLIDAYLSSQETIMPEEEFWNAVAQSEEVPAEEIIVVGEDSGILLGANGQHSLLEDLWSFNYRTNIWRAALSAVRDNKFLQLWGTEFSGTVIAAYLGHDPVHAHNSWVETLVRTGIPGLVISLVFTVLSVWKAAQLVLTPGTELWKKIIAMLTMCLMASGFLESYLFIANLYYHIPGFVFFFLTGYLDFWCNRPQKRKS